MTRKWINASKAPAHSGTLTYWLCPGKCGWSHVPPVEYPYVMKCECGYEYTIIQIQGSRVLIEVNE